MTIIRVIDFETTGTEPPAQVCEVGFCDLDLDAKAVGAWQSWLCAVSEMPPEVRAVHHITLAECQPHSEFSQAQAEAALEATDYDTKPAVLVATGISVADARRLLAGHDNRLRPCLERGAASTN